MDQDARFFSLQQWAKAIASIDLKPYFGKIQASNPWFTRENIDLAMKGVLRYLNQEHLGTWKDGYTFEMGSPKNIGIIMAGNLPLVGIHDFICVFASGHNAIVKLSSQDQILLPLLLAKLDAKHSQSFKLVQDINRSEVDAIIATGSDNTSRYIKYHYRNKPSVIRGNRSSVGILSGSENEQQLISLGDDVFTYFGRGCRNISKLYIPKHYDLQRFVTVNNRFQALVKHPKYFNNYQYQKSFLDTSGEEFIDAGYVLFTRHESIHSALGVLHFEEYDNVEELGELMAKHKSKIQCIASGNGWFDGSLSFGTLQHPTLWDYSDNVDTMDFLIKL